MKRKAIFIIPATRCVQLLCFIATIMSGIVSAEPKIFQAILENDIILERQYETREIKLTVTHTPASDHFLSESTITGEAGFDALTGRMIIELDQLEKSGMPMRIIGFVMDNNGEKGIDACTHWQTRMFEDKKLCHAAELRQGQQLQVIVTFDESSHAPNNTGVGTATGFVY